jgi:hypothetical protein
VVIITDQYTVKVEMVSLAITQAPTRLMEAEEAAEPGAVVVMAELVEAEMEDAEPLQ